MKPLYLFAIVLLYLISCTTSTQKQADLPSSCVVSVVTDITDKQLLQPAANPLLQLFRCNANPNIACDFRIRTISDKILTPISTYRLPAGATTEKQNKDDDPQFREKNILAFYDHVSRIIREFNQPIDSSQSLNNSECLQTISNELTQLTTDKSKLKYLIIFSDLNENSDLYSVYANSVIPNEIEHIIIKNGLFPKQLKDITVIFVFKPRNRQEDKQYNKIVAIYKKVIEQRGGKVFIQANNTSYIL
jgi:hypothetical protein